MMCLGMVCRADCRRMLNMLHGLRSCLASRNLQSVLACFAKRGQAEAYLQSLSPAMPVCSKTSCLAARDTDGEGGPLFSRSFMRALSAAASASTSPPRKSGGPPSLLIACCATSPGPGFPRTLHTRV